MTAYVLNSEHYIIEKFDDDYILLNQATGLYFECADNAARLFDLLLAQVDFDALLTALQKRNQDLAIGATATFEKLRSCEALSPTSEHGREPTDDEVDAFSMAKEFVVEGYDDLAAYILADPVHEFDSNGKPIAPTPVAT